MQAVAVSGTAVEVPPPVAVPASEGPDAVPTKPSSPDNAAQPNVGDVLPEALQEAQCKRSQDAAGVTGQAPVAAV